MIVVTSGAFVSASAACEELVAAGFEVEKRLDLGPRSSASELLQAFTPAWAIIAGHERYDSPLLDGLPHLRVLARPGVGYDNIDVGAASSRGIAVLTTPSANAESVADFTLGLMIGALRGIPALDDRTRHGLWRFPQVSGRDLSSCVVGIVGTGRVGGAVARRLEGFGSRVLAYDPLATASDLPAHFVDLDELLRESDVLTIHVPLLPTTKGMIAQRELELMKSGAVIVNTSRGGVVDEIAVAHALQARRLHAVAFDVFAVEPIADTNPLLGAPNSIVTPHAASLSEDGVARMVSETIRNILDVAAGHLPDGCVNIKGLENSERAAT